MPETDSIQMQGGLLRVMSRYKPSKIKAYLDTRVIGKAAKSFTDMKRLRGTEMRIIVPVRQG